MSTDIPDSPATEIPIATEGHSLANVQASIAALPNGGWLIAATCTATTPQGKVVIADGAIRVINLEVGERFIEHFRKAAHRAIEAQKERNESQIHVVKQMPRVLREKPR